MKFAKELDRDLVPEWRIKYLNYKLGKKQIKAISRAISRTNHSPSFVLHRDPALPPPDVLSHHLSHETAPSGLPQYRPDDGSSAQVIDPLRASRTAMASRPLPIPAKKDPATERQGLTRGSASDIQYGSFVPTPPDRDTSSTSETGHPSQTFEPPVPAVQVPSNASDGQGPRPSASIRSTSGASLSRAAALNPRASITAAPAGAATVQPNATGRLSPLAETRSRPPNLSPSRAHTPRARIRRMFSLAGPTSERYRSRGEYNLQAFGEVREKETDFLDFLDREFEKVETFYRQKEDQAGNRLALLRDQLHEMRNRRIAEMAESRRRSQHAEHKAPLEIESTNNGGQAHFPLLYPLKNKLFSPRQKPKVLRRVPQPPSHSGQEPDQRTDYVRRPPPDEVPYRTAKRKLKLALQEFYRELELLKSYGLLNRTAFRKLNKKYDKAVNARPPYRYMNERVNKSCFVNSNVLEGHLQAVEDLYARYFERGNRKIAVSKLRSLSKDNQYESRNALINGLCIGIGAVLAIRGLIHGAQLLFDDNRELRTQTSYLLQIYGGYFLILYLFSLFCLDCKVWTANRVNYPFIFEFDARSHLDWTQLSQFPSFFLLLFGLFTWLNFTRHGSQDMYLYYPVLLIAITVVLLFFPAPIFWHKSRKWFLYSHWRLFFAGLYPVEFRDFFLGDMYCSITYAMCNIELFFCLYAHAWKDPPYCNSSHSRLLGFFACVPPIWRFLQCIRRFRDTRNIFPHLVNCGKYTASIIAGVLLSVYRINGTTKTLVLFVLFSIVNGIYTAFWDIFMDFSLLQKHARHSLLRDITALKSRWPYFLIMTIDPILRFSWIFYAIFTHNSQHSSIASFLIGFSEVTRRGMWALLRVENEHCANVAQYRASREVPLPYHLDVGAVTPASEGVVSSSESSGGENRRTENLPVRSPFDFEATGSSSATVVGHAASGKSTGVGVPASRNPMTTTKPQTPSSAAAAEEGQIPGQRSLRMRPLKRMDTTGKRSITQILAEAHKQDFEKKRRPADSAHGNEDGVGIDGVNDEDDDDDGTDEEMTEDESGNTQYAR